MPTLYFKVVALCFTSLLYVLRSTQCFKGHTLRLSSQPYVLSTAVSLYIDRYDNYQEVREV